MFLSLYMSVFEESLSLGKIGFENLSLLGIY